jgi:hypothetical protein
MNGHERSGTVMVRNGHTVQDHGPKRLQNHGHVHVPKTKETMYAKTVKYENIATINILIQSKFPHKNEFLNVFNFNSVE